MQRVHGLPEAVVSVGGDLTFAAEVSSGSRSQMVGVAGNVWTTLGERTKKPPLTQRPSPFGFSENEVTSASSSISRAPNFPTDCVAVRVTSVSRLDGIRAGRRCRCRRGRRHR